MLFALAGSALVLWLISVLVSPIGSSTPKELSLADFVRSAPIVEIVARPPSLYVSIDESVWSAYDESQKRHLVNDMGSILLTNGYWGLLLRDSEGRALAEWLEIGGARLLDGRKDPSAAAPRTEPGQFERFVLTADPR
jgi:hypothetical protein